MRRRVILVFDVLVLAGFGVYMAMTVWNLPEALRHKLLSASIGVLARLTGMLG